MPPGDQLHLGTALVRDFVRGRELQRTRNVLLRIDHLSYALGAMQRFR
jgi:hypothetical protein